MEFIEKLKQEVQLYFVRRIKVKEHEPGHFKNLKNPNKIGLIFCISSVEELEEIRVFLNQVKDFYKNIDAIVFYPGYETLDVITNKSISLFNLNDFSLYGNIKGSLKQKLDTAHFEMMISFAIDPCPFCKQIIADVMADFKIGPANEKMTDFYDLTLAMESKRTGYKEFFEQVRHYLDVLNIGVVL